MRWSTCARDCLYLNWALPRDTVPELPAPLSYEVHRSGGQDYVFVSALLFRLSGLHPESLPWLRLSYPQMNLRLYVLDGDGRPAMLFRRMLVPFWVAPVSRFLGRQPALAAQLDYPQVSQDLEAQSWRWWVERSGQGLDVSCRLATPQFGPGPDLGTWQQTLLHFRNRSRGYVLWAQRLRPIRTTHTGDEVMPLSVEIEDASLLAEVLSEGDESLWQRPHSAWLCPEIPFAFELGKTIHLPLTRRPVAAGEWTSCRLFEG